jgi:hypothetical protein
MNYTLQEYARDVVYNIIDVCDSEKVLHPIIVSEGGRAIVAHHSVLVVETRFAWQGAPARPCPLATTERSTTRTIGPRAAWREDKDGFGRFIAPRSELEFSSAFHPDHYRHRPEFK